MWSTLTLALRETVETQGRIILSVDVRGHGRLVVSCESMVVIYKSIRASPKDSLQDPSWRTLTGVQLENSLTPPRSQCTPRGGIKRYDPTPSHSPGAQGPIRPSGECSTKADARFFSRTCGLAPAAALLLSRDASPTRRPCWTRARRCFRPCRDAQGETTRRARGGIRTRSERTRSGSSAASGGVPQHQLRSSSPGMFLPWSSRMRPLERRARS